MPQRSAAAAGAAPSQLRAPALRASATLALPPQASGSCRGTPPPLSLSLSLSLSDFTQSNTFEYLESLTGFARFACCWCCCASSELPMRASLKHITAVLDAKKAAPSTLFCMLTAAATIFCVLTMSLSQVAS